MAADDSREKDTQHPKVQFPTRKQCPKCYKPAMDKIDPAQLSQPNYEPPFEWDLNEIFKFLTTYYSKNQIETKINTISISSSSHPTLIKQPLASSTSSSSSKLSNEKNSNLFNDESLKIEEMNELELDDNDFNYQALVNQKNQLDQNDSKEVIKSNQIEQQSINASNAISSINFTFLFLFSITILAFYFIYSNFKHKNYYKLKKHIV